MVVNMFRKDFQPQPAATTHMTENPMNIEKLTIETE
jgi:hypothetical protein